MKDRKAYNAAYYQANKEKAKAYQKAHYQQNREKILARHKAAFSLCETARKDEIAQYQKAYRVAHREQLKRYRQKYRLRKRVEKLDADIARIKAELLETLGEAG
jgi:hypothetical protein